MSKNEVGNKASVAALIEIGGGLLGLMGMGHIYSGNVTQGIVLMVSWMAFCVIEAIASVLTGGLYLCVATPLHIAGPAISAYYAYKYAEKQAAV